MTERRPIRKRGGYRPTAHGPAPTEPPPKPGVSLRDRVDTAIAFAETVRLHDDDLIRGGASLVTLADEVYRLRHRERTLMAAAGWAQGVAEHGGQGYFRRPRHRLRAIADRLRWIAREAEHPPVRRTVGSLDDSGVPCQRCLRCGGVLATSGGRPCSCPLTVRTVGKGGEPTFLRVDPRYRT